MFNKKYLVNWSIAGIIEVKAKSDEDARDIVEMMTNEEKRKIIHDEGIISFEVGTVEQLKD